MINFIFILKLILTPLIVALVTVVARRWGEAIGGLLIGLPMTSGPVSIFLAVEQGRQFAAKAANSAILGLIPVTAFYVTYVYSARRFPWYLSALSGLISYSIVVEGVSTLQINGWVTPLVVCLVLFAGMLSLGKHAGAGVPIVPPAWDLPTRMALATFILVLITASANFLGPQWTGLLSPFPIFTFVMVTFSHRQGGEGAARRLVQGVSVGLFSYVAFFLVIRSLLEGTSPGMVYALATLVALMVNGAAFGIQVWIRKSGTVTLKT